jgi:hypothetical protein
MHTYRIPRPNIISFGPPTYQCRKTTGVLKLDGNLDKPFWKNAPWTEDFQDIEGSAKPKPRFRTRAKMLWDERAFYVGAELMGSEIWGTVTQRDAVIFVDNDFELFLDPDSDTHVYAEFEINVLNTLWDLLLTKPYRDQGKAITSFDIKGLKSAVYVEGEINNPQGDNRKWSVEIIIPFESIWECGGFQRPPPRAGDFWRMNFSRVQWTVDIVDNTYRKRINPATGKPCPEDNWVWSPTGLVNIHYPELWGFVFFCEGGETYAVPEDEPLKWRLRQAYYQMHREFDETGKFPKTLPDMEGITIQSGDYGFTLSVPSADSEGILALYTDGRVERLPKEK